MGGGALQDRRRQRRDIVHIDETHFAVAIVDFTVNAFRDQKLAKKFRVD